MITKAEFEQALADQAKAEAIIQAYCAQQAENFEQRWNRFLEGMEPFTTDELVYSAHIRCETCREGMAHPKAVGMHGRWSCSAVLLGAVNGPLRQAHAEYPFAFYEIKSENQPSAGGATTRPKP